MPNNKSTPSSKNFLAFVGMPGAGKSEATKYLFDKGFKSLRFGDFTEEAIKKEGLEVSTENEKIFREKIRKDMGMGAYGILIKPKIDALIKKNDVIVLDGLYSWEEYMYLRKYFSYLKLVLIYAEPPIRYSRLSQRKIRPVSIGNSTERDIREIEKLNKGGPIAIADFCITNNEDNLLNFYKKIDEILYRLNIKI